MRLESIVDGVFARLKYGRGLALRPWSVIGFSVPIAGVATSTRDFLVFPVRIGRDEAGWGKPLTGYPIKSIPISISYPQYPYIQETIRHPYSTLNANSSQRGLCKVSGDERRLNPLQPRCVLEVDLRKSSLSSMSASSPYRTTCLLIQLQ